MGTDTHSENIARYNVAHNIDTTPVIVRNLLVIIDAQTRRIEILEEDKEND